MLERIRTVRVIGPTEIELTWEDGMISIADFAETIHLRGVFAPMADPTFFERVHVDPTGRFITWPGDIDFCADALRLSATAVVPA